MECKIEKRPIKVREIKNEGDVVKPTCPFCNRPIHQVGLTNGSRCENVTVKCKNCGRTLRIDTG